MWSLSDVVNALLGDSYTDTVGPDAARAVTVVVSIPSGSTVKIAATATLNHLVGPMVTLPDSTITSSEIAVDSPLDPPRN
jgi:hypothetical protein